ncbi:Acyl-coenzyme A thioesterase 9, mitochondrial [Rhizoclosmatium sp. JEL0117]|nr:Acyl-coenzyme A thioesterase 9, mitochondrial [Rhizoclosmatium sp. JEL0117]
MITHFRPAIVHVKHLGVSVRCFSPVPKVLPELIQTSRFNERITMIGQQDATSPNPGGVIKDKRMSDSLLQVFLPFRSDKALKEEYINHYNRIRVGKVLEDLDALAGSIGQLHCEGSSRPLSIVTASVDRIDLIHDIPTDQDVAVYGHVSYVGKSSMEVTVNMETVVDGISAEDVDSKKYLRSKLSKDKRSGDLILSSKFIMVAVDSETRKAAPVIPLRLETDEERKLFRLGAEHKARKQVANQISLDKRPPTIEEMQLVHNLYKEYTPYLDNSDTAVSKPSNVVWLKDTRHNNINLTFPQDRNIHGKIFGGHLIRTAFELGYATGTMFAKRPLSFLALDDISFKMPVEVGSILDLTSQIVYTHQDKMVIKVVAHVVSSEGTKETSNEFWFTFQTVGKGGADEEFKRVLPRSYNECMLYLEGRRRFEGI